MPPTNTVLVSEWDPCVTHAWADEVDEQLPEWELDALIGLLKHCVHGVTNLHGHARWLTTGLNGNAIFGTAHSRPASRNRTAHELLKCSWPVTLRDASAAALIGSALGAPAVRCMLRLIAIRC